MANPAEVVTKALQALTKELAGEAGEETVSTAPPLPPPEPPVATDMSLDPGGLNSVAGRARQAYQKTCMWILSVFAAFGLLIFGSLPFTNIGKVDGSANLFWLWTGLGLAALGIALAVLAVSTVFSPAVTSLGHLQRRLARIPGGPQDGALPDPTRFTRCCFPRKTALWNLRNTLEGVDAPAHLGPDVTSVKELITKLGELDRLQLRAARSEAAKRAGLAALDKGSDAHVAAVAALTQRLEAIGAPGTDKAKQQLVAAVTEALHHEVHAGDAAARERSVRARELAAAAGRLAEHDTDIKEYLGHRQQVLIEANVLLMGGRFRLARRFIMAGVLCTLIGGALYASRLPPDEDGGDKAKEGADPVASWERYVPATVEIGAQTDAAGLLPAGCADRRLRALRDASVAAPSLKDAYTVVITDLPCRGLVTVPENQGEIVSPALP
ncbi:hypothetical protein ABT224_25760 [Streptomyces sp. NPDC001584]|uniref:hypothetical protein n=1 Tax=Streptomyces sp. NPDC001584 TaxID=3154521 RepID=UPI00331C96D8